MSKNTRFKKGNQCATVHGGEGAARRIREGKPFVGLAAQEERAVRDDLETIGRAELVIENAVRLHTAARLYWGAVQTAADAGDLDKLTTYVAKFGWLSQAALRAWQQVAKEAPDAAGILDYEQVLARQRGSDDNE